MDYMGRLRPKGVPFPMGKGKGLDLRVEPPSIKLP